MILGRLSHPNIVRVYATGNHEGRPYLVMELVDGETIAEHLARTPAPAVRDACAIAIRILDVLAAVRSRGLAHRDLKPENVILCRDGSARLIDFGLVRGEQKDGMLTRAGTILGTPEYMAPEQFRGDQAGPAADVYALGVIVYELLTGRPPFVGDRAAVEHGHLHMRPPAPSLGRPMSESLEKLVLACLAKEQDKRPSDLARVRDELTDEMTRVDERPSAPSLPTRAAIKLDSNRPVVLVYLVDAPADELGDVLAQGRARVARQRPDEVVLAFLGSEHERPLEAAVTLANEATRRWNSRSIIHVGRALVRASAGRIALFGRDVERPASWIPETAWCGVMLTAIAADALGIASAGERFVVAPAVAARAACERTLVGRDPELAAIREAIDGALRTARPHCCVIVGEDGVGKSALVHGIAPDAETLVVSCARPVGGDSEHALRELLRYLLRIDADVTPSDPGALVAEALGDTVAKTSTAGIAVALGWPRENDETIAPGVYRDQLRRAVIAGLQRRAAHAPLVILLDDAHFADDLTLEILERACQLDGNALAVVMTCAPRFALAGRRSPQVIELRPLDPSATAALARNMLPAGTRVSAAVLHRLAHWCGGNPGVLTQLINVLLREGIVRQHEGTTSWFVAADELERMPSSPASEWLANRELDTLSPELADFARICSLLGGEFSLDEIEAVQRGLEIDGYDRPMLDAAAGLSMLVEHRVVVERVPGRFSFRRSALQEALYALVPDTIRVAVHRSAYVHWCGRGDDADALFRLAHHGSRGGFAAEARAHYATLAARAKSRHAYQEAERMLTAAIELCAATDDDALYDLLETRGNVRRLLTHYEGARADFARARQLAGDPAKVVSVLVAEAAVCDFTQEWDAQARLMQSAQEIAHDGLPVRVEARYRNWLGVARARQGLSDEAIELLTDAAAMGAEIGDHETEVGSGLLLGYLLVVQGQRRAGLKILNDVIVRCEHVGDWVHLVMGLNNRIILSKLTDSQGQAEADCQRAIEISHEHGYHQLEIWGLHILSLARWWRGDFTGAFHAARLAYELSFERFGSKSSHRERLYYAMHLVADGRGAEVRELLDGLREQEFESSPIDCANLRAIRLALDGRRGSDRAWRDVIARTREVGDDSDFIEVLWLRGRSALHSGDRVAAYQALGEAHEHATSCGAPIGDVLLAEQRALAVHSARHNDARHSRDGHPRREL
jgi:tetratricopeptide (TPR) repeat protein